MRVAAPLFVAAGACLVWLELMRPLRRHAESKSRRGVRNVVLAAISAAVVQAADRPVTSALMNIAERRAWGVFRRLDLPLWLEFVIAGAMLDYSMYLWHILLHRAPLLWRFHVVHHCDLGLDVSTALRFHFGELLFSIPLRAAQIVVLGPSRFTYSLWQTCFGLEVFFHHSEVELPPEWERRLIRFIVTPRMHGIHHSIVRQETDSNWSSGLTIWDRIHGTLRLNVPQQQITIGVPAYRQPLETRSLVGLPFHTQPPAWELPGGGTPMRPPAPGRTRLVA